jgi:hypothetical protein
MAHITSRRASAKRYIGLRLISTTFTMLGTLLLALVSLLLAFCLYTPLSSWGSQLPKAEVPFASRPIGGVLVQLASISNASDQKREPGMVHYSDIPGRVQIIGKLGQPLGQLVTVRGRWTAPFPSKPGLRVVLMVNQVNSRPLDPPAEFDDVEPVRGKGGEITKRAVGEEWELRGVETGGFVGFSDKVWEELGQPPASRPPRGFLTRFCYVKAKRVSGSKPIGGGKE